jgi:surface protein
MKIKVKFIEQKSSFNVKFGAINSVTDGGYEKGFEAGYSKGELDGHESGYNDGYSQGVSDTMPKGTIEITENGTHNVKEYETATVNVQAKDTLKALLDTTKSTYYLFYRYYGDSVDGLIPYNATSNVTTTQFMFYECANLTTVPLFNTSNVTTMQYMFAYCSKLTTVSLFNTSNVTTMGSMFNNCKNLTTVSLFNTSNVTNMGSMFNNCTNLKTVKLQGVSEKLTSTSNWFYGCKVLELIDFRGATGVPKLSATNAFYNVPSTCKVVIPDSLYDTWVNATNWSAINVVYVKESEFVEA